jgi:hypothetical protein
MPFRTKDEPEHDWVTDATETIERTVDSIRDKAVVPLTTIARALVYGILIAIVGSVALIMLAILITRMLIIYIDNIPGAPDGVWLPYLVSGAIFVIAGLFCWYKRSPSQSNQE